MTIFLNLRRRREDGLSFSDIREADWGNGYNRRLSPNMTTSDDMSFPVEQLPSIETTDGPYRTGTSGTMSLQAPMTSQESLRSQESTPSQASTPSQESMECPNRKALSNFFGVCEDELTIPFSSTLRKKKQLKGSEVDNLLSDEFILYSSGSSTNSITENVSKNKKNPQQVANESGTGLWLRENSPSFKRKDRSAEPSTERYITRGNGRTNTASKRKNKTKRIAALIETGFNLKKKQNEAGKEHFQRRSQNDEGLFKLYANFPESEQTCRRVFVDKLSKAEEIVRDFLDLSPVSYESYNDFVLCDVVGWYHSKLKDTASSKDTKATRRSSVGWKEECVRVLDGKENPLVVQSLWVPKKGCSRRFEIRRKTDTVGDGGNLAYFDLINGDLDILPSSPRGIPVNFKWDQSSDDGSYGKHDYEFLDHSPNRKRHPGSAVEKEDTESSDENASVNNKLLPPKDRPYIICIQGYSVEKDLLFHGLYKETLVIGNPLSKTADGVTKDQDIQLHAPDILPQHCILTCHRVADLEASSFSFDNFVVSIEPYEGGKVSLNGCQLHHEVELRPGDLVSIGNYYHFIFRDATSKYQTLFGLRWMGPGNREEDGIYSEYPHLAEEARKYESDADRWKLAYKVEHESDVLAFMSSLVKGDEGGFGLASGHLFLMMTEFAAYTQGPEQTRMTMLNIANNLLEVTEMKAKEMVTTHVKSSKPDMDSLIPDLKVLLVALSNSLELLNCLQVKLPDYLPGSPSTQDTEEAAAGGNHEVLSILEEVVMYSFQQCVYYITKTLYESLPHILSANPFVDEDDTAEPTGVSEIITIFKKTFDLLHGVYVHPEMISQLFAYLLFFMNAALFNVLLEKAASGKYLKWSKGVQIRGNLNNVESWILDNGMEKQNKFLQRISSAADLLATPKIQLMQATWSSLRRDFSSLRPAQLHQLLSKYELSNSTKSPAGWDPVGEDIENVKKRDSILESFEDHPPLMLPSESSKLDLYTFGELPRFQQFLENLHIKLPFVQVYQGASIFSSRKQNRAPPEKPSRANLPPVGRGEDGSHGHIYAAIDSDEKEDDPQPDTQDKADGRHSGPDVIPEYPVDEKLAGKVSSWNNNSASGGSKLFRKLRDQKKVDKKTEKEPEKQVHKMASEKEASQLLETYISEANRSQFDSIPEEVESPVAEGCLNEQQMSSDASSSSTACAPSSGSEGSLSPKDQEFEETMIEDCEQTETGNQIEFTSSIDEVYVVDLTPEEGQLGIEFGDRLKSPAGIPGVYIKGFEPDSTASFCDGLQVGDRILAVDGHSLVGFDYDEAVSFITKPRESYRMLVARTDAQSGGGTTSPITAL